MVTCERCGNEIAEQVTICPSCGTPVSTTQVGSQAEAQQPSEPQKEWSTLFPASAFEEYTPLPRPMYERNYTTQSSARANDIPQQPLDPEQASTASQASQPHQPFPFSVRIFHSNVTAPVLVEALLSLFPGIYGVGWLLAGEIPVGVLLLLASFIIYLPLVVISFILADFTFGLSIFCTGPLAISAILFNALMLNRVITRKHARDRMAQPR